jgi:hypothetical protein
MAYDDATSRFVFGTLAHLIFCALHLTAIIFGVVGLIVTIPLHIIYTSMNKK